MTTQSEVTCIVIELVVYKLKADVVENFDQIQPQIEAELKKFPGFISFKSTRSLDDKSICVDYVEWASVEQAKDAAKKVMEMEQFKPMMDSIKEVIYMGHLKSF